MRFLQVSGLFETDFFWNLGMGYFSLNGGAAELGMGIDIKSLSVID